jgi:anti-anti-sigma regulatory factor
VAQPTIKPNYDIAMAGEALEIRLHRDFDANGRDSDWVNVLTNRFPGPYPKVILDLSSLGQRVNSSFFSGLYRLHQQYTGVGRPPVVLRGAHDRVRQGLEILALGQFFTLE